MDEYEETMKELAESIRGLTKSVNSLSYTVSVLVEVTEQLGEDIIITEIDPIPTLDS